MSNPTHHFNDAPLGQIIDFILPNFHDKHRTQLPELIAMAEKVESRHADSPACPKGLATLLRKIYDDLVHHMMKEEQILFPLIKSGRGPMAARKRSYGCRANFCYGSRTR